MYSRLWITGFCMVCLFVLSCSYCYIPDDPFAALDGKENLRIEVHLGNGDIYQTRNYSITSDTLYIKDYSTAVNKSGTKIARSAIKYIHVCEYNTEKGFKTGRKFVIGFVLFWSLIIVLAPRGTVGG